MGGIMSESDNTRNAFQGLKPEDVQSVSAGGVSVTLRDPTQTASEKWRLEIEKRRAQYNPLFYQNWNDKSQRRA